MIRPFKERIVNVMCAASEFLLFIIFLFLLIFFDGSSSDEYINKFGFALVLIILIFIISNWIIIVSQTIKELIRKIKGSSKVYHSSSTIKQGTMEHTPNKKSESRDQFGSVNEDLKKMKDLSSSEMQVQESLHLQRSFHNQIRKSSD